MTKNEAMEMAKRLNTPDAKTISQVVRILPEEIDPVVDGDNGWDVETTILRDDHVTRRNAPFGKGWRIMVCNNLSL
jgi:hypothetical protein